MKSVSPFLNFDGKTEEAFIFYSSVFGGEISSLQRYKDMPGAEGFPASEKNKVMYAALPLGKVGMLLASDVPKSMAKQFKVGTNASIMLEAESEGEAKRLFKALSQGGEVTMPLQKTFWGALYGNFADKYGVCWMVNYTYPQPPK
jgi:PhnB protein